MPTETSVFGSSTGSTFVPNTGFKTDQSGTLYDTPMLYSFRREGSLATFQDAALSQVGLASFQKENSGNSYATHPSDVQQKIQLFQMLVDAGRFEPRAAQRVFFETGEQEQFEAKLATAFESDPLEDGKTHLAEQIIGKALRSSEGQRVLGWLRIFSLDVECPSFAASVLRCLGRQASPGTASWRAGLIRTGLNMENAEMRDAAVQAVESWGEQDLVDVLRTHHEPEPWLREYIQNVIDDLGR